MLQLSRAKPGNPASIYIGECVCVCVCVKKQRQFLYRAIFPVQRALHFWALPDRPVHSDTNLAPRDPGSILAKMLQLRGTDWHQITYMSADSSGNGL